jgi:hypothetical protein
MVTFSHFYIYLQNLAELTLGKRRFIKLILHGEELVEILKRGNVQDLLSSFFPILLFFI